MLVLVLGQFRKGCLHLSASRPFLPFALKGSGLWTSGVDN